MIDFPLWRDDAQIVMKLVFVSAVYLSWGSVVVMVLLCPVNSNKCKGTHRIYVCAYVHTYVYEYM